jgi:hypothetical protein
MIGIAQYKEKEKKRERSISNKLNVEWINWNKSIKKGPKKTKFNLINLETSDFGHKPETNSIKNKTKRKK